jgi:hypothetical protein
MGQEDFVRLEHESRSLGEAAEREEWSKLGQTFK